MPQRPLDPDRLPIEFRPFALALLQRADADDALIRLLGTLGERVPEASSRQFALQLRDALPDSAYLRRVTDVFLRKTYPTWYIEAVNDRHRNAAYARALAALVQPDSIVLEAGTGSGLFALLAARAGARHVYTCEADAEVAAIATENIARNGFADRITVFAQRLEDLGNEDLPPADLLLHEFVSGEFLNAGIHGSIARYRRRWLRPGGHVLPQVLGARGMLVGDAWLAERTRVPGAVLGFDLSSINRLAVHGCSVQGPVPIEKPLSDALTLIELDLAGDADIGEATRIVEFHARAEARIEGVLLWIVQRFPDGTVYENRPELRCNWWPRFWPLNRPREVRAGETLAIRVRHTATELFIDEC